MNKQFYRTKYNAKLGTYVAVSELAKSHQSDTSPRIKASIHSNNNDVTDSGIAAAGQRTLKQLVLALSALMAVSPIYANVVVNNNAAAANKATVLKAGNTANVWITAPTASGVSRNSYTQFDVNQNGVILNNSRGAATSQITKTSIAANPNLARGAATTIVNEVASKNPSLLQGNLEVLGSRANVIIANPSGITVNGGGFINANQVTLSTGVLGYNSDGSIKQHTVQQGAITINPDANKRGLGGNANNPIALELLGRSIAINAPVNATTITTVTGANTITADTGGVTATTGTGTKPAVAIDVAQLGGLYANSIYLHANEVGVGVNNAGVIQALNNVVLNSNGKIEHKGTISSTSKTQGLVSINTTGTGVAGDINSSGSINSNSMISIDSGNHLNVNVNGITINKDGVASSPLIINAKGNVNLAANTRIYNDSSSGGLYVDAANINLATNSGLTSNRGSAYIQSQKDIVAAQGARLVAAYDLNVSGKGKLSLIGNTLQASVGSINLETDTSNTQGLIDIQAGTVYVGKDLNLYSSGDINLKNLGLAIENGASRVKNIKAYSDQNLKWDNAGVALPQITGKVQLDAANQIDLIGSTISNKDDISLQANKINLGTALNSQKNINITSKISDLSLDKVLTAQGDINVSALAGGISSNSLKATSSGKISIVANKNVGINSIQKAATPVAGKNTLTTDKTKISGQKGITIGSIGDGSVKLKATDLTAQQGTIQLLGQNGVSLERNTDVILTGDTLSNGVVTNVLTGQEILIDNNKSNINIENTRLTATIGKLAVSSKAGMTTIKDSVLTSKGNTELHAKDLLTLQGMTATSDQHLAVNSGRTVYINAEYTPSTVWIPNKVTNLTSKGVTSVTATGNQVLQNANIIGGAVLMEAGGFILGQTGMNYNATGSDLLKNNAKLNSLNGDLSIQTGSDLTIDPTKHKLTAVGDIDLVSKKGNLTLIGYGGATGNGSEKVINLNTANGGINLQGNKINLQGSQLAAAKDISIVSTGGDLVIDGVRNAITNQHTDGFKAKQAKLDNDLSALYASEEYKVMINNFMDELIKLNNKIAAKEIDSNNEDLVENETFKLIARVFKNNPSYYSKYVEITDGQDFYSEMIKLFNVGYVNGEVHTGAKIISERGDIKFVSNKGLSISGSTIDAKDGKVNLEAAGTLDGDGYNIQGNYNNPAENSVKKGIIKGSIIIDANQDSYEQGSPSGSDYRWFSPVSVTTINGNKGISIKATGKQATDNLILQGVSITSDGDVNIEAYKNIIFDVAINNSFNKNQKTETKRKWYGKKKTITTIQTSEQSGGVSVDIDANNINIKSQEKNTAAMTGQNRTSIDMYSSQLTAIDGKINIQAGGDLNFLTANDEKLNTTDISKKSSFLGVKLNKSQTTNTRNVKSELPAVLNANYIGTKSGFDTRLKGTVFKYLDGATIQAGGNIILEGASNTITETLKKESNSVVWQSMQDKGSITETAKLPSFNGPTAPKFVGSLTVQVPVAKRTATQKELIGEIEKLAKQPGNEYLKSLVDNKDQKVNWEQVLLTNENWNYKSQGLTGAGAAIIVIIVTVLTSGAGSAAATSVTSATGVASLGAGAQAAVVTLASQASVSLINNGGDVGKTLKDLGSKESVRSLAASVVTAGLLNEVGTALKLKPDSTYFPDRLMNNFTNAVGSTLVQTAISGGNLQDNLEQALLAGLSGALQGELASQIGTSFGKVEPGTIEYVLHKVAHAAAGCATAAATKASCEAGAIGAGVGEIVAELMIPEGKNALDLTDAERTKIKDTSKIVAGSVAAFAGYDVNTAANSANVAVENNALGKVVTTAGKAAYKVARKISDMPAAARANLKPSEIAEMLRKEGVQGVVDIGDNLLTLVSPTSTVGDRAFALIDLAIGVDLKAGKNIDALKVDRKIIEKNVQGVPNLGGAKGLVGVDFELYLKNLYGGKGSFKLGGREFDGALGNRWYEAKSGNYWNDVVGKEGGLGKFTSDMGSRLAIAKANNATYELHSNTPIPQNIKDWLTQKGIKFYEH